MARKISRREALALLVGAGAVPIVHSRWAQDSAVPLASPRTPVVRLGETRLATTGVPDTPAVAWKPVTRVADGLTFLPPSATVVQRDECTLMWSTMLDVGTLTGGALQGWYVWYWHHDTHDKLAHFHLQTAPSPAGPWSAPERLDLPPLPADYDGHYDCPTTTTLIPDPLATPCKSHLFDPHLPCGDIVWDAANRRFLTTPHAKGEKFNENGQRVTAGQDSFILTSNDGRNWSFIKDTPSLISIGLGDNGLNIDSAEAAYGRLLRRPDGSLAAFDGVAAATGGKNYWWLYRGTAGGSKNSVTGQNNPIRYTPILAKIGAVPADDGPGPGVAGSWHQYRSAAFTQSGGNTNIFGVGSFVQLGTRAWAILAVGNGPAVAADKFEAWATKPGQPTVFEPAPIVLTVPDPSPADAGTDPIVGKGLGSIVFDSNGRQYMTVETIHYNPRWPTVPTNKYSFYTKLWVYEQA